MLMKLKLISLTKPKQSYFTFFLSYVHFLTSLNVYEETVFASLSPVAT